MQGWSADAAAWSTPTRRSRDIALPVGATLARRPADGDDDHRRQPARPTPRSAPSLRTSIKVYDAQGAARRISDLDLRHGRRRDVLDGDLHGVGDAGPPPRSRPAACATLHPGADESVLHRHGRRQRASTLDLTKLTGYAGQHSMAATTQNGSAHGHAAGASACRPGRHPHRRRSPTASSRRSARSRWPPSTTRPAWRRSAARCTASSVNSGNAQLGARRHRGPRRCSPPARWRCRNVDLAAEFTNLIVAQRGFQANSPRHHHRPTRSCRTWSTSSADRSADADGRGRDLGARRRPAGPPHRAGCHPGAADPQDRAAGGRSRECTAPRPGLDEIQGRTP